MKISFPDSPASHIWASKREGEREGERARLKVKEYWRSGKVKKGKAIVACMTWLAPAKYILIKHELRPMWTVQEGRGVGSGGAILE